MSSLTKEEQARLDRHRSPEGESDWRVSDLAWADYQRLVEKERSGKHDIHEQTG